MKDKTLNVYINKTLSGELSFENDKYVYNYTKDAKDVVSITMPIRASSWVSKKLHPIFEMNMPEGTLKEVIKNHFAKLQDMSEMNFLRLIGPYMLWRVKFEKIVDESEHIELNEILNSSKERLFWDLKICVF